MPTPFDFAIPPFDLLTGPEQDKVLAAVDIVYYPLGQTILAPGAALDHVMVVIKGLLAEKNDGDLVTVHGPGDLFGASLMFSPAENRAGVSCDIQEEALVYLVPTRLITDLCRSNAAFEQFFTQSLSERIAARAQAESARGMASFMVAKVAQAYLHPAIFIDGTQTLRDAATCMKTDKATSLLVIAGDDRVGVLSGSDLRDHAIVEGKPLDTPVVDCATFDTVAVHEDEFLFTAQVLMTRHNIRRLPVLRQGAQQIDRQGIVGVLELIDLLGYMSSHSHLVAIQVDRAQSIDDLRRASEALEPLLQGLHGSGVKVHFIAEMVTDLNRKIQRKLYDFLMPPDLASRCCLMVMGSEGRGEQMAKTDQDNAMIVADDVDPESLRSVCQQFTDAMVSFGYPLCSGGMMVCNPVWTKTLGQFRTDILTWLTQPDETSFLNLAAFIDGETVAGDAMLLQQVRTLLFQRMTDHQGFLAHFARPVNAFETPIGFFHQLVMDKGGQQGLIDIKKGGLFPIVHGIRALSLEQHVQSTSTLERIDALAASGRLFDQDCADNLKEAFQVLMALRLQARLDRGQLGGQGADNFIRADDLSRLQIDALKDSLLIVKHFKQLVSHHFKLSQFS